MSKRAKSARGEMVDFDLLSIKQHLAATPVPVSVQNRRKFIDERDGLKSRENFIVPPPSLAPAAEEDLGDPLAVANEGAKTSRTAKK